MKAREKKIEIKLEDYQCFLQNPKGSVFSYDQLNQIIYMHGFKKIHRRRKIELYEALCTIDLLKPQRSTLKQELPVYDAALTLDEVKQDLEALQWQECPVQSIEAVNPTGYGDPPTSNGCDDLLRKLDVSPFNFNHKRRRSVRTKRMSGKGPCKAEDNDQMSIAMNEVDHCIAHDHDAGLLQCEASSLFADTYGWAF